MDIDTAAGTVTGSLLCSDLQIDEQSPKSHDEYLFLHTIVLNSKNNLENY